MKFELSIDNLPVTVDAPNGLSPKQIKKLMDEVSYLFECADDDFSERDFVIAGADFRLDTDGKLSAGCSAYVKDIVGSKTPTEYVEHSMNTRIFQETL